MTVKRKGLYRTVTVMLLACISNKGFKHPKKKQEEFDKSVQPYQDALDRAGYDGKLAYSEPSETPS